ncbi:MAG: CoA transferase [Burkholderiaceae bacterium]|nr:CoA transferase [Burkholderiaceae bacterium]
MAAQYAAHLLQSLGMPAALGPVRAESHPAIEWACSGLMALTGQPGLPPLACPVPLPSLANGALAALAALAPARGIERLDGGVLLAERAALGGLSRRGRTSCGGATHLLACADGDMAVTLSRPDDWELMPAWLEQSGVHDIAALGRAVAQRPRQDLLERGRMLGLPVASSAPPRHRAWHVMDAQASSPGRSPPATDRPLVVDLSGLWAGPLCGSLLALCGARVVKVESGGRPDGARQGNPAHFHLLNAGKASVALAFDTPRGREQLHALLRRADIVIEASRPRALMQLGIDARELVRERQGQTWISLTGHGLDPPADQWVAFGDDAGVSAGLSWIAGQCGPLALFCGDAVADPLAGIHAALLAWSVWLRGGGRYGVALSDVVSHGVGFVDAMDDATWTLRHHNWQQVLTEAAIEAQSPESRPVRESARALGADTTAVLQEWGIRC